MSSNASQKEDFILVHYYDRASQAYRLFRTQVVKRDRFSDRVLAKGRDGRLVWFIPDYYRPRFYIAEIDARLLSHG